MRWGTILAGVIIVVVASASFILAARERRWGEDGVEIRGEKFKVEIADEEQEQIQGLSGRDRLCQKCGFLFLYPDATIRTFWMKDMKFPLDFIWIREGQIVDLSLDVPAPKASQRPTVVSPREPVDAVLEVPTGTIARLGLVLGDPVRRR